MRSHRPPRVSADLEDDERGHEADDQIGALDAEADRGSARDHARRHEPVERAWLPPAISAGRRERPRRAQPASGSCTDVQSAVTPSTLQRATSDP